MNNLTNQENAVVRADFIVCSPDDDLENCLCKRLQREIDDLREQLRWLREKLRWRTDWENIPEDEFIEIKRNDCPRIDIMYVIKDGLPYNRWDSSYRKICIGWREIPELPEVNHDS